MTATPEQIEALARALCALYGRAWEEHEEWRHYYTLEARRAALAVDILRPLPAPPCGELVARREGDLGPCELPAGHDGQHDDGLTTWDRAPAPEAPASEAGGCEAARPRGAGGTMSENQIKHVHHCPTCHAWTDCAEPCRVDHAGGDAWVPMGADRLCQVCLVASAPMSGKSEACPGYQGDYAALSPCPRDWTCPTCFGGLGKKAHDELVCAAQMMNRLTDERDSARQEVERLRGELAAARAHAEGHWAEAQHAQRVRDAARAETHRLQEERDEAVVEAERHRHQRDLADNRADAARAELAQSEQRWQDAQHERDRLRVELKAQSEELARLRAPVWTEATQEAVGMSIAGVSEALWRGELSNHERFMAMQKGRFAVEAWLAALAQGARPEGER